MAEMCIQTKGITIGTKVKWNRVEYEVATMPMTEKPKGWYSGIVLEKVQQKRRR